MKKILILILVLSFLSKIFGQGYTYQWGGNVIDLEIVTSDCTFFGYVYKINGVEVTEFCGFGQGRVNSGPGFGCGFSSSSICTSTPIDGADFPSEAFYYNNSVWATYPWSPNSPGGLLTPALQIGGSFNGLSSPYNLWLVDEAVVIQQLEKGSSCDNLGANVDFFEPYDLGCKSISSITTSHQSGGFFPCGCTNVTGAINYTDGTTYDFDFFVSVSCNPTINPITSSGNDHYEEICQFGLTYDLTSFIINYNQLSNPVWVINDGSGTIVSNPAEFVVNENIELSLSENNAGCIAESIVTFENVSATPNNSTFHLLIGNVNYNKSKKVKLLDNNLYVAYDDIINGLPQASMIKFDRLGNEIWHTTMDYVSSINDFILDEECQILAVGHKGEFSVSSKSESLILRFNADDGSLTSSTNHYNGGREEFKKIIRQTIGGGISYYITGTWSGISPSNVDRTSLYKYALDGTFSFSNYYTNSLTDLDEESDRGLLELSDSNILIMGNDGQSGKGLVMKINGSTGDFINGIFTDEIIDFYDAIETTNGDIILVGEKFDSDEGIVVMIDQNLTIVSSHIFSNITDFRQIIRESGDTYFIAGKAKNTAGNPVLFSMDYNSANFTIGNGYSIDNNETSYENVWFDYDPINNKIAYTDTRFENLNGFGDFDILLGVFDDELSSLCTQLFLPLSSANTILPTSETFTKYPFSFSTGTAPDTTTIPLSSNSNICGCEDNAISFDGSNDFLYTNGFSTNSDFSISLWFNAHSTPNGGAEDRIVSFGPNNRLEIGIQEGGPFDGELWVFDGNRNNAQTFGTNVRDGNWHHIVFVRTGLNSEMYLDGSILGSYSPTSSNQYGPNFAIGRWTGGPASTHFKGLVDEVSIWNTALSSADAASLFGCSLDGTEYGLVSLYKMNQGFSGGDNTMINQVTDLGTGANHLALTNFTLNGSVSNFVCSTIGLAQACTFCSAPPIALCRQNPIFSLDPLTDQLILDVSDIDDGSNSVCNSNVSLSFDPSSIVSTITFDCPDDIGLQPITLYVNDANGLQSFCTTTITISSSDSELEGLKEFYDQAGGDMWHNTIANDRKWFEDCDPCGINDGTEWFGISCTNNGTILEILLSNNNLRGTLLQDLTVFPDLLKLDVNGDFDPLTTDLSGNFPIVSTLNLNSISIGRNSISGPIPAAFNSMSNLRIFFAPDNQLSGFLPDFNPLMQDIRLNDNGLTGPIPPAYGEFTQITNLDLSNNDLSGCYDYRLYGICNSTTLSPPASNSTISDGNMFDADWDDFCSSGAGFCCIPDLVIVTDPIQSGFYFATNTITINTTVNSGTTLILDAPVINVLNPANISGGATLTTYNVGCTP